MSFRPIKDIIRHQQLLVAPGTMSISEAAALMKKHRVGAVMVMKQQQLVGIFTERDALFRVLAEHRDPKATRLEQVMSPSPRTITSNRPFGHALHMMYEGGFRHVPVVDRGKLVGCVSARDALSAEMFEFESEVEQREHIAEIL